MKLITHTVVEVHKWAIFGGFAGSNSEVGEGWNPHLTFVGGRGKTMQMQRASLNEFITASLRLLRPGSVALPATSLYCLYHGRDYTGINSRVWTVLVYEYVLLLTQKWCAIDSEFLLKQYEFNNINFSLK